MRKKDIPRKALADASQTDCFEYHDRWTVRFRPTRPIHPPPVPLPFRARLNSKFVSLMTLAGARLYQPNRRFSAGLPLPAELEIRRERPWMRVRRCSAWNLRADGAMLDLSLLETIIIPRYLFGPTTSVMLLYNSREDIHSSAVEDNDFFIPISTLFTPLLMTHHEQPTEWR